MAEVEAQRAQQLEEARQQEAEQQKKELARLRKELVTAAGELTDPRLAVLFYLCLALFQKDLWWPTAKTSTSRQSHKPRVVTTWRCERG